MGNLNLLFDKTKKKTKFVTDEEADAIIEQTRGETTSSQVLIIIIILIIFILFYFFVSKNNNNYN